VAVNDSSYAAYGVQTTFTLGGVLSGTTSSGTGDSGGGLQMTYTLYVKFAAN
jgi:hypothetical protein